MADNKSQTGEDRKLIAFAEDYERRDWATQLSVTEEQLAEAVRQVGHSAEAVRTQLGGSGRGKV